MPHYSFVTTDIIVDKNLTVLRNERKIAAAPWREGRTREEVLHMIINTLGVGGG